MAASANDLLMRIKVLIDGGTSSAELNRLEKSLSYLDYRISQLGNRKIALKDQLGEILSLSSAIKSINLGNFVSSIDNVANAFNRLKIDTSSLSNLKNTFNQIETSKAVQQLNNYEGKIKSLNETIAKVKKYTTTESQPLYNFEYEKLNTDLQTNTKLRDVNAKKINEERINIAEKNNQLRNSVALYEKESLSIDPTFRTLAAITGEIKKYNTELKNQHGLLDQSNERTKGLKNQLAEAKQYTASLTRKNVIEFGVKGTDNLSNNINKLVSDINTAKNEAASLKISIKSKDYNDIKPIQRDIMQLSYDLKKIGTESNNIEFFKKARKELNDYSAQLKELKFGKDYSGKTSDVTLQPKVDGKLVTESIDKIKSNIASLRKDLSNIKFDDKFFKEQNVANFGQELRNLKLNTVISSNKELNNSLIKSIKSWSDYRNNVLALSSAITQSKASIAGFKQQVNSLKFDKTNENSIVNLTNTIRTARAELQKPINVVVKYKDNDKANIFDELSRVRKSINEINKLNEISVPRIDYSKGAIDAARSNIQGQIDSLKALEAIYKSIDKKSGNTLSDEAKKQFSQLISEAKKAQPELSRTLSVSTNKDKAVQQLNEVINALKSKADAIKQVEIPVKFTGLNELQNEIKRVTSSIASSKFNSVSLPNAISSSIQSEIGVLNTLKKSLYATAAKGEDGNFLFGKAERDAHALRIKSINDELIAQGKIQKAYTASEAVATRIIDLEGQVAIGKMKSADASKAIAQSQGVYLTALKEQEAQAKINVGNLNNEAKELNNLLQIEKNRVSAARNAARQTIADTTEQLNKTKSQIDGINGNIAAQQSLIGVYRSSLEVLKNIGDTVKSNANIGYLSIKRDIAANADKLFALKAIEDSLKRSALISQENIDKKNKELEGLREQKRQQIELKKIDIEGLKLDSFNSFGKRLEELRYNISGYVSSLDEMIKKQRDASIVNQNNIKGSISNESGTASGIKTQIDKLKTNIETENKALSDYKTNLKAYENAIREAINVSNNNIISGQRNKIALDDERASIVKNIEAQRELSRSYVERLNNQISSMRTALQAEKDRITLLEKQASAEKDLIKQQELMTAAAKARANITAVGGEEQTTNKKIEETKALANAEMRRLDALQRLSDVNGALLNNNYSKLLKESNRLLAEANTRLGDYESRLTNAKSRIEALGQSGASLDSVKQQMGNLAYQMKYLKDIGAGSTQPYTDLSNQYNQLREVRRLMNEISRIGNAIPGEKENIIKIRTDISGLQNAQKEASKFREFMGGFGFAFTPQQLGMQAFQMVIDTVGRLISSFIDVNRHMETLQRGLSAVFGGSMAGAIKFDALRESANTYGLELQSLSRNYMNLSASTDGTSLQGQKTEFIFKSLSAAMAVLGADTITTQRAFRAVGQMISKGQVYAEELKGQLAEALPGAIQMFARSMGVGTQEFLAMVKAGRVGLDELVPFFEEVNKKYGDAAITSSTFDQSLNRLSNSWTELMQAMGESGTWDKITEALTLLNEILRKTAEKQKGIAEEYKKTKPINNLKYDAKNLFIPTENMSFDDVVVGLDKEKSKENLTKDMRDIMREYYGASVPVDLLNEDREKDYIDALQTIENKLNKISAIDPLDWIRKTKNLEIISEDQYNKLKSIGSDQIQGENYQEEISRRLYINEILKQKRRELVTQRAMLIALSDENQALHRQEIAKALGQEAASRAMIQFNKAELDSVKNLLNAERDRLSVQTQARNSSIDGTVKTGSFLPSAAEAMKFIGSMQQTQQVVGKIQYTMGLYNEELNKGEFKNQHILSLYRDIALEQINMALTEARQIGDMETYNRLLQQRNNLQRDALFQSSVKDMDPDKKRVLEQLIASIDGKQIDVSVNTEGLTQSKTIMNEISFINNKMKATTEEIAIQRINMYKTSKTFEYELYQMSNNIKYNYTAMNSARISDEFALTKLELSRSEITKKANTERITVLKRIKDIEIEIMNALYSAKDANDQFLQNRLNDEGDILRERLSNEDKVLKAKKNADEQSKQRRLYESGQITHDDFTKASSENFDKSYSAYKRMQEAQELINASKKAGNVVEQKGLRENALILLEAVAATQEELGETFQLKNTLSEIAELRKLNNRQSDDAIAKQKNLARALEMEKLAREAIAQADSDTTPEGKSQWVDIASDRYKSALSLYSSSGDEASIKRIGALQKEYADMMITKKRELMKVTNNAYAYETKAIEYLNNAKNTDNYLNSIEIKKNAVELLKEAATKYSEAGDDAAAMSAYDRMLAVSREIGTAKELEYKQQLKIADGVKLQAYAEEALAKAKSTSSVNEKRAWLDLALDRSKAAQSLYNEAQSAQSVSSIEAVIKAIQALILEGDKLKIDNTAAIVAEQWQKSEGSFDRLFKNLANAEVELLNELNRLNGERTALGDNATAEQIAAIDKRIAAVNAERAFIAQSSADYKKLYESLVMSGQIKPSIDFNIKTTEVIDSVKALYNNIKEIMQQPIDVNIKVSSTQQGTVNTNDIASQAGSTTSMLEDAALAVVDFFFGAAQASELGAERVNNANASIVSSAVATLSALNSISTVKIDADISGFINKLLESRRSLLSFRQLTNAMTAYSGNNDITKTLNQTTQLSDSANKARLSFDGLNQAMLVNSSTAQLGQIDYKNFLDLSDVIVNTKNEFEEFGIGFVNTANAINSTPMSANFVETAKSATSAANVVNVLADRLQSLVGENYTVKITEQVITPRTADGWTGGQIKQRKLTIVPVVDQQSLQSSANNIIQWSNSTASASARVVSDAIRENTQLTAEAFNKNQLVPVLDNSMSLMSKIHEKIKGESPLIRKAIEDTMTVRAVKIDASTFEEQRKQLQDGMNRQGVTVTVTDIKLKDEQGWVSKAQKLVATGTGLSIPIDGFKMKDNTAFDDIVKEQQRLGVKEAHRMTIPVSIDATESNDAWKNIVSEGNRYMQLNRIRPQFENDPEGFKRLTDDLGGGLNVPVNVKVDPKQAAKDVEELSKTQSLVKDNNYIRVSLSPEDLQKFSEQIGGMQAQLNEMKRLGATNIEISKDQNNELTVTANVDPANQALNDLVKRIAEQHAEINVKVNYVEGNKPTGFNQSVSRFSTGGLLPGYGGGDRIHALLEPGEFVLNKRAVRWFGVDRIKAINDMIPSPASSINNVAIPRFSSGGAVSATPVHFHFNSKSFSATMPRDQVNDFAKALNKVTRTL